MLAVVIVSWNVRDLLRGCLRSLLSEDVRERDVIVVDSASSDGSAGMLRAEFPGVALIASADNIGFVKGNNLALAQLLRAAPAPEYLWLLNPDTIVQPGAVRTLLAFMQSHPRCGLLGPQLQNPDGSLQHGAFALPGLIQLAIDVVPRLQARLRNSALDGRYPPEAYAGAPFRIGTPLGAAMLARTQAVREVGLLDDGFEMYSEEIDLAHRMHRAGWEVWCEPRAVVTHFGGASSSQASQRTEGLKWRSRQRYFRKHYHPLKRWLARRLVPGPFREP
jgi:N-acetylglucosaminyl-diphospho-decaprenol L-rhamnosyltransferase